MSWHDRLPGAALAAALALGLALGGCQVRPLYATPGPAQAGSTVAALKTIAVEPLRDELGQEIMNQLIFALRGGSALEEKRFVLRLLVSNRTSELGLEEFDGLPTATLVVVTTTYTLTEVATGRVVTTGSASATASYDVSTQRFANLRAARDAERRAAGQVATEIRTQLATKLATGG